MYNPSEQDIKRFEREERKECLNSAFNQMAEVDEQIEVQGVLRGEIYKLERVNVMV